MQNKYHFQFTPLALQDIDGAMTYIVENLANSAAASNLYTKLEEAIESICRFPYAFADCSCYLIADKNIRHIKVGNYILIYEVVSEKEMIHILRFRYSMMDFSQMDVR